MILSEHRFPLFGIMLVILRGCGHRGQAAEADLAETRQLEGRVADIEAGDQAKDVDLDAFDPAQLEADETPEARFDAGAAVARPDIRPWPEIASDRIGGQGDAEFR